MNDFKKVIYSNGNKKLRKANFSINESVEASSNAFDSFLKNLLLEYHVFKNKSGNAIIQIFYEVGLIDRFDTKAEYFKEDFTLIEEGEAI